MKLSKIFKWVFVVANIIIDILIIIGAITVTFGKGWNCFLNTIDDYLNN